MNVAGRKVLVVGLAASGRAAAALAARHGADVVGVDLRDDLAPIPGVKLQLGPHQRETFLAADVVVVSPGVPATQPDLVAAEDAGAEIVGELAFAASFLDLPTVAVTGTNGKSTVTWFTGQILRFAGRDPFVGGNLGNPLSSAVGTAHDTLVVEVSSYQMEWPGTFRPDVALILNLTPDHLARHGDMDTYGAMKARLFARMDGWAVLPAGDARLVRLARGGRRAWLGDLPGVRRDGDRVRLRLDEEAELDLSGFTVPGEHNKDNAAAAALAAFALGVPAEAIQAALPALEALPHRMQVVAERGGVTFIDDSKATNVAASVVGIGGLGRPAVVLLGGQAKGGGFHALAPVLAPHRAVVTFGASGEAIAEELEAAGVAVERAGALEDAVDRARALARPGDAVLLSPGCASFDAFDNFEHRGRVFARLAQEEP